MKKVEVDLFCACGIMLSLQNLLYYHTFSLKQADQIQAEQILLGIYRQAGWFEHQTVEG